MKEKKKQKEITFLGTLGLNTLAATICLLLIRVTWNKLSLFSFVVIFVSTIVITTIVYYLSNNKSFEIMYYDALSNKNWLVGVLVFIVYCIFHFVFTRIFGFDIHFI